MSSVENKDRAPDTRYVSSTVNAASSRAFLAGLLLLPSAGRHAQVALLSLTVATGTSTVSCPRDSMNFAAALVEALAADAVVTDSGGRGGSWGDEGGCPLGPPGSIEAAFWSGGWISSVGRLGSSASMAEGHEQLQGGEV